MRKLAVFVEGLTEQLFIDKFIAEIAGRHTLAIEHRKVTGGKGSSARWVRLWASSPDPQQNYFILIVDCSADNRVKSEIRDHYDSLVSSAYTAIIGIRDVFPDFAHADVPKVRSFLEYGMKTKPLHVVFALGVMEIETWFICEHTHFGRLDTQLTNARISGSLGFDPYSDDIQLRPTPAADLDSVYRLVGQRYSKNRRSLQRTVDLLDYGYLYLSVMHRIPDLKTLVRSIDAFLSP
jgi:hypothetical protein